mgnify:CR=1 FL=1
MFCETYKKVEEVPSIIDETMGDILARVGTFKANEYALAMYRAVVRGEGDALKRTDSIVDSEYRERLGT